MMCSIHDVAETRIGDIPSVGKRYLTKPDEVAVLADQVSGFPGVVSSILLDLMNEYEERVTLEARMARDADKIECLAQAMEYMAAGHPSAEEWITGSFESISTPEGQALGRAVMAGNAHGWWQDYVSSYRTPPPPQ